MAVINGLFWFIYCLLFFARLASPASPSLGGRSKRVFCLRKPNQKINYPFWLFLLSLLPIISIFRQGTYESGDLSLHTYRLMTFWESISQGEIIPRWAGSLNAGYGYPLFQFIYPLPYYLASFWHWLGFGFINSIKITIALFYVLSGLVFYRLVKKHFSDLAAFTGATLYLFSPYHLVDLHFRVAFGEIVAFVFLPLTLLCGYNYVISQKRTWAALSGLSFAGLILSHQAISLVSPIIIIPYWWLSGNIIIRMKRVWIVFKPLLLGLTLSAFYWIPVLVESRYTLLDKFSGGVIIQKISEYLYSPWRLGFLFQGPNGELSFLIGYVHLFLVVIAIVGWRFFTHFSLNIKSDNQSEKNNKVFILLVVLFFVFCILLSPVSKIVWKSVPLLGSFQFSYRLLLLISFITSFIGALLVGYVKRPFFVYLIIFITVSTTILNWGNRRTIPQIDDNYLRVDLPYATIRGEKSDWAGTKWSDINDIWQKEPAKEIIKLNKNITNYQVTEDINRQKVLLILTDQPTLIKVNQLYFPGWTAVINNEEKPILFEQKDHYGMIAFHVPTGESLVEIEFKDTLTRKIAGIVSLLGSFIAIVLLLRPYKRFSRQTPC